MKINIFQAFICGCVLKHNHSLSTQPESRESCLGLCQHSESQRNYSNAFPAGVHWQVRQRCALGVGTASRIGMLIPNVGITKQILCCQWPHVDFISLVRKACSKKKTKHAWQWGFEICNSNVCWHREGRDLQWGRYAAFITGIPVLPSSRLCGFGTYVWENNVIPKVGSILGSWRRLLSLGGAGPSVCLHCFPHAWMHRECSSLLPPEHRFSQCQTAALSSSETLCNEYPFPALSTCFISHS